MTDQQAIAIIAAILWQSDSFPGKYSEALAGAAVMLEEAGPRSAP